MGEGSVRAVLVLEEQERGDPAARATVSVARKAHPLDGCSFSNWPTPNGMKSFHLSASAEPGSQEKPSAGPRRPPSPRKPAPGPHARPPCPAVARGLFRSSSPRTSPSKGACGRGPGSIPRGKRPARPGSGFPPSVARRVRSGRRRGCGGRDDVFHGVQGEAIQKRLGPEDGGLVVPGPDALQRCLKGIPRLGTGARPGMRRPGTCRGSRPIAS